MIIRYLDPYCRVRLKQGFRPNHDESLKLLQSS